MKKKTKPKPVVPIIDKLREHALRSPLAWFGIYARILNKLRQEIRPVPNIAQIRFAEAVEWCIAQNIPCRIIMVKPRKVGISTFAVAVAYWLMRKRRMFAAILADKDDRSDILFDILKFIAEHDTFKWNDGNDPIFTNKEVKLGTAADASRSQNYTAGNPNSAIGETPQILVATEAAHYPKGGVLDGTKTMTNTMNSIAKEPWTFEFVESTAAGREGFFPDMWDNAHWPTFYDPQDRYWERYKDGQNGGTGGFIRVFVAWWEMSDYVMPATDIMRAHIEATLSPDEKLGIQNYGWTVEQIAWRRDTIQNECLGKENNFKRDFPASPDEPFNFSGSPRFDVNGMLYMTQVAKNGKHEGSIGVISDPETDPVTGERLAAGVAFNPTVGSHAWFKMWEEAKIGCKYIIPCDVADDKDMNPASSDDNEVKRDRHAPFVLRAGYRDDRGVTWRPRVVGRIVADPPCRYGHDQLAYRLLLMSLLYGGCPIVPEMNNHGLSVARELRRLKANLISQTIDNPLTGQAITRFGHQTTAANRPEMIEKLDRAFRTAAPVTNELDEVYLDPDSLEIFCNQALAQCGTFMIDKRGNVGASSGNHDDDVMGIAIGYFYIGSAKVYTEKIIERKIPDWDYKVVRDIVNKPKSILGV